MGKSKVFKPKKSIYSESADRAPPLLISDRMEVAYAALKNRFQGVNLKLKQTNEQLLHKIGELNFISHYLDSILNNVCQAILFVDSSGNITTYNKAAEDTLGVTAEKALFHPFWDSFADDILGFSVREALEHKHGPQTVFAKLERGGDHPREIESECSYMASPEQETGNPSCAAATPMEGLIIMVRDITEYRRLEMIAQRKHRMNELGEMASMVAHEIRNPLGGIKGFASLLERDLKDRPELQKMASYIIQGTDNLNEIVTRVLNFSRPVKLHFKSTNLVPLVRELDEHLQKDEKFNENVKVKIEIDEDEIFAPVDVQSLRASILNLCVNAIQAMPEGGILKVKLSRDDDLRAVIKVSDTGVGIPPENIKKIFSPFFTTRPDGNGFGLSEVHKTIQSHEGTIDVDSEPGKGTVFTIHLPLKRKG